MRNDVRLTLSSVGVCDCDGFTSWAFGGECHGFTPLYYLNDIWNKHHSDLFVVYNSDNFFDSIKAMGRAYLSTKGVEGVKGA